VVQVTNPALGTASRFVYDGLGRLVRVVDARGATITADHSYTWCGSARCLAHDNTQNGSPISSQYFAEGVILGPVASGTPYYYLTDSLGSVRGLVSGGSGGPLAAQYTYDPYGNRTTVSGTAVSDMGDAGYFYHAASGLDFALHRAYDPAHGPWLNRDPIGEAGGVNLYAYVGGNPTTLTDPSGLFWPELIAWARSAYVWYTETVPWQVRAASAAVDVSALANKVANYGLNSGGSPDGGSGTFGGGGASGSWDNVTTPSPDAGGENASGIPAGVPANAITDDSPVGQILTHAALESLSESNAQHCSK